MEGIHVGPLLLRWNGLLIMLGFAVGGLLAAQEARRRGHDSEIILELILPLLLWGTIGARLWHVFTPPLSSVQLGLTTEHYLTHALDLFATWIGGLGFPGALLGGAIGLYFFCRKHALRFGDWADILAPALPLGQAIGRAGNYFNQELYGLPTNVPWKLFIDPEYRLAGYEKVEYYHPLFAYESILSLFNLFLVVWVCRRFSARLNEGDLFLLYVLNYAAIRFGLEFLRLDVSLVRGLNVNQAFMVLLAFCSVAVIYGRRHTAQEL